MSQTSKMVPVTDQSSIAIRLEVDSFIHSAYGIRKFLMQVRRDQVRTIGELERKIQLDLGITKSIGLFYANEFYLFPDVELSLFEDLGMISVRPAPMKLFADKSTQTEPNGSGNPEGDDDSGMSDTGEADNCTSMNHSSSEQVGQAESQNVETAAEKRNGCEDSVLYSEEAGSLALTMPLYSTFESTSPLTVQDETLSTSVEVCFEENISNEATRIMSLPLQSRRFGPLPSAPLRSKLSFSPYSFTSQKQKNINKKHPNSPTWLRKQSLPVIGGVYSKASPTRTFSRHGALENLSKTSGGTQIMQDNLGLAENELSSLEIREKVKVEKVTPAGDKPEQENDTLTLGDSLVPPTSI